MSRALITESYLSDIADAIRAKNGSSDTYTPPQMAAAIEAIPTGGGVDVEALSVTQNGTYTAPTGKAYSPVTVNVSGGGGDDPFTLTDYIESSGTQWIDTGYIVKDNSRFDVVYAMSASQPNYPALFGVRDNDSSEDAGRCIIMAKVSSINNGVYAWGTTDLNMYLSARMYLSTKKQRCVFAKGSLLVQQADGNALALDFTSSYSASNTRSIYICTLNHGGADFGASTHFSGKIYRFRIYEGDTLVHEYIPWMDGNNVVCLKDTVTNNLLYNAGTGVFVRGSDT